jgi:dipeptidyl aminopeptidase/acylaminoacyl peptidase
MKTSSSVPLSLEVEASFNFTSALTKVRSAQSPVFSPDGDEIAFLSDLTGLPQIWSAPLSGGWAKMITALDDPIKRFAWSPDGHHFIFELAAGGSMRTQLYLIRADGTGLCRLTEGDETTNQLGLWHPSGRKISFSSNHGAPAHLHTYWLDLESREYEQIAKNKGLGHLTDFHQGRGTALLHRMDERTDSNLYHIDLNTGEERCFTPHLSPGIFPKALFASASNQIYFISNQGREYTAFAQVNLDHEDAWSTPQYLVTRENANLVDFALSTDGTFALQLWNQAGVGEILQWDIASRNESVLLSCISSQVISELVISPDNRYAAYSRTNPTAPLEIFLLDLQAKQERQISFSPHAGVNFDKLINPTFEYFPADDGLMLNGWLYLPKGHTKPGAVVINFHGGPEAEERPSYNALYQALLAQGIAVFAPNIRGSSGFGKSYENLDDGALRENALSDIRSCVDYLLKEEIAHSSRIGIMGASYGGYMTLVGLTRYYEYFSAGVVCSGFSDFETFFAKTEAWIAQISKKKYGDPQKDASLLHELSPLYALDILKAPLLIFHGENDTNVPVVEAEQVVEKLLGSEKDFEYFLFEGEGHDFFCLKTRAALNNKVVSFFDEHLSGE